MATTRDYIEYLNDQVDISPANSQEELDAAQLIMSLMNQHSLETHLQEFSASTSGTMPYRILSILLFLGVVLSGFYGTPAAVVGLVLVFVSAVLFLLKLLGYDLLSGLGIRARSQNVIGVHRAEGPLVVKGNRPIVVVAHYDTPRKSFLYSSPLSRFQPMVKRYAPVCIAVASVFGLFQLLGFIPEPARRTFWILGILAALPPLMLGVDAMYQLFSACTDGAVDNKASVAAMLGVMSRVRPGDDAATGYALVMDEKRAALAAEQEAALAEEASLEEDEGLSDSDFYDEDELADELDDASAFDEGEDASEDEDEAEPDFRTMSPEDVVDKIFADEEALAGFATTDASEDEPEASADYLMNDAEYEVIGDEAEMEEPTEGDQGEDLESYDESSFAEVSEDEGLDAEDEAAYAGLDVESSVYEEETAEEPFSFMPSFARVRSAEADSQDEPEFESEFEDYEAEVEPQIVTDRYETVEGARHGEDVIRSLRMLPKSCNIEYLEPRLISRTVRPEFEPDYADYDIADDEETNQSFFSRVFGGFRAQRNRQQQEVLVEAEAQRLSFLNRIRAFFLRIRDMILGHGKEEHLLDASYDEEYEEDALNTFEGGINEEYEAGFEVVTSDEALPVVIENPTLTGEPVLVEDSAFTEEPLQPIDVMPGEEFVIDDGFSMMDEPLPVIDSTIVDEPALADEPLQDIESTAASEPLQDIESTAVSEHLQDIESTAPSEPLQDVESTAASEPLMADDPTGSILAPGITFTDEPSPTDDEIDLMDGSGLTEFVEDDLDATNPQLIKPAPKAEGLDDPMWGKSEYEPPARSIGRRATLFDLPDPSEFSSDPFAKKPAPAKTDDDRLSAIDDDEDGPHWKGGATTRVGLREEESEMDFDETEPSDIESFEDVEPSDVESFEDIDVQPRDEETDEELRDAVLSMSDDELIAHDVWFVALGASELDHAGMASFLREYRSQIRGAFLVNLDCVGAGDLNLLTNEGVTNTRRSDRRIMRLLTNIAEDLHIPVDKSDYAWEETDATSAMRRSVRALTIMGMEDGIPALSHTSGDTSDKVNPAQVSSVAAMVTELIRRS